MGSMWNNLPHTVEVFPITSTVTNKYGAAKNIYAETGTDIKCIVRLVSSTESFSMGKSINSVYRVTSKTWAGGVGALIIWKGHTFHQIGEADDTTDINPRIGHFDVLMEAMAVPVAS